MFVVLLVFTSLIFTRHTLVVLPKGSAVHSHIIINSSYVIVELLLSAKVVNDFPPSGKCANQEYPAIKSANVTILPACRYPLGAKKSFFIDILAFINPFSI